MVILIANDQHDSCQSLAEHLAGHGNDQVSATETMADIEESVGTIEVLDVLLFSTGFASGRGKELRDRLRLQFRGLQTVNLPTPQGGMVPSEKVTAWQGMFRSGLPHGRRTRRTLTKRCRFFARATFARPQGRLSPLHGSLKARTILSQISVSEPSPASQHKSTARFACFNSNGPYL